MSKKRRRLKKPIRHALYRTINFGKKAVISGTLAYMSAYILVPIKATVDPMEVTKTVATLKSANLTDAKTLKEVVIDTYNSENDTDLTIETASVIMSYPAVVTTPSIENATFKVVEKTEDLKDEEQEVSKIVTNENVDSEVTSNTNENHVSIIDSTNTISTSNNTNNVSESDDVKGDEAVNETEATTDSTSSDTNNSSVDFETTNEVQTSESNVVKNEEKDTTTSVDLDEISTVKEIAVSSETNDLDNKISAISVANSLQSTISETTNIELKTTDIVLAQYTKFDASEYVDSVTAFNNPFPIYKTEGNVDTSTVGTYELKYTVVDVLGNSDSETLTIEVVKNAEQLEAERLAKVAEATQEFVDLTNGKAWDMDGAYGDQCWDLWAKYVISEKLDFDYGCAPDGYADYVYKKYGWSGADKYFAKISKSNIQNGDWLFWDKGSSYPDSHVALLVKDYGNGTGLCLTQSRGNGTRLLTLNLDVLGGFRRIA